MSNSASRDAIHNYKLQIINYKLVFLVLRQLFVDDGPGGFVIPFDAVFGHGAEVRLEAVLHIDIDAHIAACLAGQIQWALAA